MSRDCIDVFKVAMKRVLEPDDLNAIVDRLNARVTKAEDDGAALHQELSDEKGKILDDHASNENQREFRAYRELEKKNAALKLIGNFAGRKENQIRDALLAYNDGSPTGIEGSRASGNLRMRLREMQFLNQFQLELKNKGLMPIWSSKDHELDLAQAIQTGESQNPKVTQIATLIREQHEMIKELFKEEGIFINTLEDRITRNIHNKIKLKRTASSVIKRIQDKFNFTKAQRDQIAFERWKNFTLPKLNQERVFKPFDVDPKNPEAVDQFMKEAFNTFTDQGDIGGITTHSSNSLLRRRIFHWKDAQSMVEYNRQYGAGTLQGAIENEFRGNAAKLATLEKYGTNPEKFIQNVVQAAREEFPNMVFDNEKDLKRVMSNFNRSMATLNDPMTREAQIGGNIRRWKRIVGMPFILARALTDLAPIAVELNKIHGNFLLSAAKSITATLEGATKAYKKEFADLLKSAVAHDIGANSRYFDADGAPTGVTTKMERLNWKFSGMGLWDKAGRSGVILEHSRHLALNRELSFDDMIKRDEKQGEINQKLLKAYNLTGNDWDAIRQHPIRFADNKFYITPDSANSITDEEVKALLEKEGATTINAARMNRKRNAIRDALDEYFIDRSEFGIFRPTGKDQFWFGNTRSGTAVGQILRTMAMFKMFATSFVNRVIMPKLYGNGAETFLDMFKRGSRADFLGLAQVLTYSSLLGYLGTCAVELGRGKSCPDPFKRETIIASMKDGGFFSLYGDYLLQRPQEAQDLTQIVLGPYGREVNDMGKIALDAFHGQFATKAAFNFVKGNLPLMGLSYGKLALDYLLFNHMQEAISPRYFAYQKAQMNRLGQHYIFNPR